MQGPGPVLQGPVCFRYGFWFGFETFEVVFLPFETDDFHFTEFKKWQLGSCSTSHPYLVLTVYSSSFHLVKLDEQNNQCKWKIITVHANCHLKR